ncbi:extracellular solute-binding protein [Glycomyces buryatensis]|uniref:Extracellular solute-binding protein n=1 Tax=Glycomyces buryatensis TaxID=2570927 RepID=A0A4S8PZI7_9ACTN|nr:extracellular solute-binding protein [Glycomyces buryatensis]THV35585.1 extracellular solute-binding protein [Glycomyces buryatensis]
MVEITRRNLFGAVGIGAGSLALGTTAGCSDSSPTGGAGGDYELPTYQAAPELTIEPAHVTETEGMENIYTDTVKEYFKSVDREPGSGGTVTSFQLTWGDPSTKREDNPYWQELEKRVGVTWEPTFVPQPVYDEKFSTMLAGGDIPDLVFVNDQSAIELQAIQDGAFADLSEVLSGDNILKWPNLAARKEEIWKASLKDGRIYQIPSPAWALTNLPIMRTDLIDQTSIGRTPQNADEMLTMLKEVTALGSGPGDQKLYGVNQYDPINNPLWKRMFRVGSDWQLDDSGKLIHAIETPQYKEMLTWLAAAWAEGVFDPNSMTATPADIVSGSALTWRAVTDTFMTPDGLMLMEKDLPGATWDYFDVPGYDGEGQLVVRNIPYGKSTCVGFQVAEDEDRLTEVLNVLDYFCAPYGSEEQLFLGYGVEGEYFEFNEFGIPVLDPEKAPDMGVQNVGVTSGDNSYRGHPNQAPWVESFTAVMESMAEHSIARDLEGLESQSQTFVSKGAQLVASWDDFDRGVVSGRESVDDLESFIGEYMAAGGEKIRAEYTEALGK